MFNWLRNLFRKPETTTKEKWISGVVATGFIFALGFAGGRMDPKTWAFYDALQKPSLTPPGWVFPIAWTTLFALIAISGYFAWNQYKSIGLRKLFALLYFINGILVYLWSFMFFERQSITWALLIIIGLLIVSESMILTGFKNNAKSAYLLLPYFVWLLFAAYLNVSIVALNP